MTKQRAEWEVFERLAIEGESPEVTTGAILDLLHCYQIAVLALTNIIAECPRPTKPYGKKVVEIAKTAIKESVL